ncbi:ribosome assembly protein RRB1 [Ascobolus immersus RN42]|uniref:Glutamate-rich WD repeat-containing protein 1 n=1 Tax=Ascobolus immersus RN42 TaxID=1160509 RepID=A0A3N4HYV3_ASCIM|nr:ribosome assembly protein RRB1 [Ascobolus immersus RN42]
MSKRSADAAGVPDAKTHKSEAPQESRVAPDGLEFEDDFEDEFESEGEVEEYNSDDDDDVMVAGADGLPDADDDTPAKKEGDEMEVDNQVFIPSRHKLGKDEILEPDPSVYHMLHTLNVNWPCLSFDIIPDDLGDERRTYPASVYLVTGTQASKPKENEIMVLKLSGLNKMKGGARDDDEEEEDDDDDSDTEDDPILESRSLPTNSVTNRIRMNPNAKQTGEYLAASMAENGDAYIWDLTPHYRSFDSPGTTINKAQKLPKATIKSHRGVEGYGLDWSPLIQSGALLTGDNSGKIYLTTRSQSGGWKTDENAFKGHTGSIEEIQWSPTEQFVFASGSSDGTVKIWDTRSKKRKAQLSVDVSSSDINVMSWNKRVDFLLATGADDGVWGVWDLRKVAELGSNPSANVTPIASFNFHKEPITSIEFHPTEDSVVQVCSADNTITLWDLSVELDDEESKDTGGVEDIPPQLLFCHYMKDVKEAHWQKQMPGVVVATGGDGFGVWKSISV